jgi:hypothetical protein
MSGTGLEFFATAEEQRPWLVRVLRDERVWALAEWVRTRHFERLTLESTQQLAFEGREYSLRIFIGRRDLRPEPVFRPSAGGLELDFGPSRAVQFVPSMKHGDTVLEGQLSILKEADYARMGVSFGPLAEWFAELSRSLTQSIKSHGAKLITLSPGAPPALSRRRPLVSPGVIELRRQGARLKQFLDSNIEFDIEVATRA